MKDFNRPSWQEARSLSVQAALLEEVKRNATDGSVSLACMLAERMGYHDYFAGRFVAPRLLSDDRELLASWEFGQEDAAVDEEMDVGRKLFPFSPLALLRDWKGLQDIHEEDDHD